MSNVAIIEDQPIIALSLEKLVQSCNLKVELMCDSGEKFIEQAVNKALHLVLIDINLKGRMNGVDVAKTIRMSNDCPIIFISGMLKDYSFEIATISNCQVLEKPFDFIQAKIMITSMMNH